MKNVELVKAQQVGREDEHRHSGPVAAPAPPCRPREPQSLLARSPRVVCRRQGHLLQRSPAFPATLLARAMAGLLQGSEPPLLQRPAPSAHAVARGVPKPGNAPLRVSPPRIGLPSAAHGACTFQFPGSSSLNVSKVTRSRFSLSLLKSGDRQVGSGKGP